MNGQLQAVPEDWSRAMAIVAHPDDLEYGAASAIARWTRAGRSVAYVMVTDGESGIDGLHPLEAGPVRQKEQVASAALVGVGDVAFLGHHDGVVEGGLDLRRDITREVRRFRPEVLVTATFELTYGMGPGQHILNQADHRAVGVAVLDAARDVGNRWIFPELLDEGYAPWDGVRHVYVMGANEPTHAVDVTDALEPGVASLRAHEAYLRGLGRDFDPETFVRGMTAMAGPALGVPHAVAFGQIQLQGV
ncbi:PIG-L deacetylase family protein [Actinomycetospora chibensis]|uniref:PIG-L deacetylase family protein n=1 Tax=Actinomycetospora chibensis TaxID=663606 RepID=A0ABV9RL51_9PSEU|nr:PIG-L deacetylase family protein [Actinomycetospora chibensis]MDD7922809.1 PIG-L family deacetylase [Actinomycetospora chibensis]